MLALFLICLVRRFSTLGQNTKQQQQQQVDYRRVFLQNYYIVYQIDGIDLKDKKNNI